MGDKSVLGLPHHEHKYSLGRTDIYACVPQYYVSKTYIKGGQNKIGGQTSARFAPTMNISIPWAGLT